LPVSASNDLSLALRIDSNSRTNGVSGRGTAARTGSGAAFVPAGGEAPSRVAGPAPMAAATGIDAILALQAVEDPLSAPRRKAVRRGASLLDMLDSIKADLLVGQVAPERLDQLVALLAEAREQAEPGLSAVLDDIDLRVQVELAKLGRYPTG